MKFKHRLKELRKSKNLTQEELASALGISKSAISMYENGNREPDIESLEAIADYFNVDINYLTGSKKAMIIPQELKDIGVEWIVLAKKFRKAGLTPEQVEKLVEAIKDIK